jgi:hypothetical protein
MLSPNASKAYVVEGVWPTVRDDDWCGEWKILPRRPGHVASAAVPLAVAGAMMDAVPYAGVPRPATGSPVAAAMPTVSPPADTAVAMAAD